MPTVKLHPIIRQLVRSPDEPDPVLLRRFVAQREEAAFAAIVHRHGRMVLDVCRCVLGNHADAEDAFQATFLTLARKAASVRKAASLASWLHGVAHRIACKARTAAARRRAHEAQVPKPAPADANDRSWGDVQQVLHEELLALPERLRAALVLCYLEGLSQDQAAASLKLTQAAMKKRLERGREQLRTRLARRGLGPAAVLATVALLAAAVPPALANAAIRLAVTTEPVPATILALTEGGIASMKLTKLKVGLCVLPVFALGVALAAGPGQTTGLTSNAVASATNAESAIVQETPAEKELKRLAGEWKVTDVQAKGASVFTKDELKDARIVFKGDKAEVKGFEFLFVRNFSFKIDPTKNPKEIDITFLEGPQKGKTFEGIYQIRKNELRIGLRLTNTDLPRPAGYATDSGTLQTFILEPAEAKDPPAAPTSGPVRPAALPKEMTARIVVREPVPVLGVKVYEPLMEIESSAPVTVALNSENHKLEITDDRGRVVPEAKLPRANADNGEGIANLTFTYTHQLTIPAGGYVGVPIGWRGGVELPRDGAIFLAGSQNWTLPPGTYTVKGAVTLTVPIPHPSGEGLIANELVKLDLKPTTFTVPK